MPIIPTGSTCVSLAQPRRLAAIADTQNADPSSGEQQATRAEPRTRGPQHPYRPGRHHDGVPLAGADSTPGRRRDRKRQAERPPVAYRDSIHLPDRRTVISLSEVEERQANLDRATRRVIALVRRPCSGDGARSLTNDAVSESGHLALRRRE